MSDRPLRPLLRGPVIDKVTVDVVLDPYLTLRGLAGYSGIAARTLRMYVNDPTHPLPAYTLGGRLLFRVSEFDRWLSAYRRRPRVDVDGIVADVLGRARHDAGGGR